MNLSATNVNRPLKGLASAFLTLLAVFAAAAPALAWTDTINTATPMRKVHMDELRSAANAKTMSYGFPDHSGSWTDPTITAGSTLVRAAHITEIRGWITVVQAFFRATCPAQVPAAPAWTDPTITPGVTALRGVHVTELRNYIDAIGNAATCCSGNICSGTNLYTKGPQGYSGCAASGYLYNCQTKCFDTMNSYAGCTGSACSGVTNCPYNSRGQCYDSYNTCYFYDSVCTEGTGCTAPGTCYTGQSCAAGNSAGMCYNATTTCNYSGGYCSGGACYGGYCNPGTACVASAVYPFCMAYYSNSCACWTQNGTCNAGLCNFSTCWSGYVTDCTACTVALCNSHGCY